MPKYIVQDTHIRHGKEGDKVATLYGPGVEIELTEKEAGKLGSNVVPVIKIREKEEKEEEEETEGAEPTKDKKKKPK
jgi:hypothetical protein